MKFELKKNEIKKSQMLDAVFKCIFERGIAEISMRSIAKEAKINQSTLHYYFKTKENLLIEFIRTLFDRFIYDIEKQYKDSDPPGKKLEAIFEAGKNFSGRQQKLFTVFIDCWSLSIRNKTMQKLFADLYEKIAKLIENIINEGKKKGEFNSVREDALSIFIVALVGGTGLQLHVRKKSSLPKDHFDVATEYFRKIIVKEKL